MDGRFRSLPPLRYLLVMVVCGCAFLNSPCFHFQNEFRDFPPAGQFASDWVGGYLFRRCEWDQFYDRGVTGAAERSSEALLSVRWNANDLTTLDYPPLFYLLISPFSFIPFRLAAWTWAMMLTGVFIGAIASLEKIASRRVRIHPNKPDLNLLTGTTYPWVIPLCVLFLPAFDALAMGSKAPFALLIFVSTYFLLSRQRSFWAGVVFGALALDPRLALVGIGVMLWKRNFRFGAGVATTLAFVVVSCFAISGDLTRNYLAESFSNTFSLREHFRSDGHDLLAIANCITGNEAGFITAAVYGLLLIATIVVLGTTTVQNEDEASPAFANQFGMIVLGTVAISPGAQRHDLILLLLPTTIAMRNWFTSTKEEKDPILTSIWAAAWVIAGHGPLLYQLTGIPLLAIFFGFLMIWILVHKPETSEGRWPFARRRNGDNATVSTSPSAY